MAVVVREGQRAEGGPGALVPAIAVGAATPREGRALRIWEAYGLVFLASGCSLVLEILAGRILAPYLGVSLYTWTSIIGVILAGITLGNYLGGLLADRMASRALLRRIFLYSALTVVATVVLAPAAAERIASASIPLMLRIVLATAAAFLIPSTILGTITPIVVKLSLRSLDDAGATIGRIYAVSAAGSIAGTFMTGFLLIDLFGSRTTVWLIAALLLLCGLAVGPWRGPRAGRGLPLAILVLFLAVSPFLVATKALPGPCQAETSYFCIRIETTRTLDGRMARGLFLDRLMHSALIEDDPGALLYDYERVYRALTEEQLARDPALRLLVIGAGGYSFPRYMTAYHPAATVETLEIDPGVVRFNQRRLGLPTDSPIVTHIGDARLFLNGTERGAAPRGAYRVVQGDAFNDVSVPYHLTTREFDALVRRSMTPDGIYLVNMVDSGHEGRFVQAYTNTLRAVFGHVVVYALDGQVGRPGHATFVIAASDAPLVPPAVSGWTPFAPADLAARFASRTDQILTDDYAPVDTLLRAALDER
jgi:spermidine synthase